MNYTIELEQETDERWIAEVINLPGVMAYGISREDAIAKAQALALRVEAEKLEQGEREGFAEAYFLMPHEQLAVCENEACLSCANQNRLGS